MPPPAPRYKRTLKRELRIATLEEAFLLSAPCRGRFSLSSNFSRSQRPANTSPPPPPERQGFARPTPPSSRPDVPKRPPRKATQPSPGTRHRDGPQPATLPSPAPGSSPDTNKKGRGGRGLGAAGVAPGRAPGSPSTPGRDPETRRIVGARRAPLAQTFAPGWAGRREGRGAEPTEGKAAPRRPPPSGPGPHARARDAA